jgi:hypothetical protein
MNRSGFKPAFATASEAAEAVRQKIISARELIDITFQRIDRHNPKLNAVIWQDREAAMTRAKQLDVCLSGCKLSRRCGRTERRSSLRRGSLTSSEDSRRRPRFKNEPGVLARRS